MWMFYYFYMNILAYLCECYVKKTMMCYSCLSAPRILSVLNISSALVMINATTCIITHNSGCDVTRKRKRKKYPSGNQIHKPWDLVKLNILNYK